VIRLVNALFALTLMAGALAATGSARPDREVANPPVFSGNGGRSLPPFRVRVPSTMRWTNTGDIFQTFASGLGGGGVNSRAHSGATYLKPGTYKLQVNAIGSWRIRVTRGIERPRPIGGGLIGFKGDGGRDLPPFTTRRGTNLVWTNTGSIFQVFRLVSPAEET
jgi:hypothetical protein